jgi:hypothetical protein
MIFFKTFLSVFCTKQILTFWTCYVGIFTDVFIEKLQNPLDKSSATNRVQGILAIYEKIKYS